MWRADKHREDFTVEPDLVEPIDDHQHAHAQQQVTAPHAISLGDPTIAPVNAAEPVWAQWRTELAGVGGRSPLLHFVDEPRMRIELSTTHPGGLAQFITGKTTLLSNLIRDELALRSAKLAAAAVAAKGLELTTARGIDAVHLGIGLAEWSFEGEQFCAPVLLRPLAIRRHGRDFEVKLRGAAYLNPAFAAALDAQFQLRLDAEAFVALTDDDGTFKPNPVIDRLRGLTSHLDSFRVSPRLVVSTFADVAAALRDDASDLTHPVLDALAGNETAQRTVKDGYTPVQALPSDERSPQTDNLLLDADSEQENVIAQIAAGNSLVVKTLPGTGGTQTIVNAIGTLVAQNKRVLVVGARRASLQSIAQRLGDVGLPGLAVGPRSLRRDIIRSITRSEKAKQPNVSEIDDALVRLRKVLVDYRGAIAKPDPAIGVSVLDCVTELSRLALLPHAPSTTARLNRSAVESARYRNLKSREASGSRGSTDGPGSPTIDRAPTSTREGGAFPTEGAAGGGATSMTARGATGVVLAGSSLTTDTSAASPLGPCKDVSGSTAIWSAFGDINSCASSPGSSTWRASARISPDRLELPNAVSATGLVDCSRVGPSDAESDEPADSSTGSDSSGTSIRRDRQPS